MRRATAEAQPALCELLEHIYASGHVETPDGELRDADPDGIPRAHALRLAQLVREQRLERTLETGFAYGLSTLAIAGVHAERGSGEHIAIDPSQLTHYAGIGVANVRRAGIEERVRVLTERSQSALPRLHAEGVRLDFAFVDGMHLFDYALTDFFHVDQMLDSGGFVAFHDTWMPAIADVVSFVLANRDYERLRDRAADGGMAILRKRGPDRRVWHHYRPFARSSRAVGPPEEEGPALLARLRAAAEAAAARAGGFSSHELVLAGAPARMRFAGPRLESAFMPAFAHARSAQAATGEGLDVVLFEGGDPPEVPWSPGDVRARGDVRGFERGDLSVFAEPASDAITIFDRERGEIVYWVADAMSVPWYERGAPLRAALHHWAAAGGRHFVHAAAVATGGAGVLLAGASGSGKSTTALACLAAGFEYAGDDYVILDDSGDEPRAHCLYSTAKLDGHSLELLPELDHAVVDMGGEREMKAVLDLASWRPALVRPSLPLAAIVIPSIGGTAGPAVSRASAAAALRALAPTTLLQLPGAAHERMRAMAALVRRLPVFAIELGSDIDAVPEAVAGICAEASRSAGSRV